MPLMSMTGFGSATVTVPGQTWRIELKSVNHKALSLRMHLPPDFAHCEHAASARIRQRLMRGSVELRCELETDQGEVEVQLNRPALTALMRELQTVAQELSAPEPTLEIALRQPNLLTLSRPKLDPDVVERGFLEGLEQALDALVTMRRTEGAALAADIDLRLTRLEQMVETTEREAPRITAALLERLRQRVLKHESEVGQELDHARIATELVVFSDRSDVTEELVRTRAHLTAFREALGAEGDEERGRRLDFLTQELLRELNTLGSKCREAGIIGAVVDAKVELEKIREQAQNIA